MVALFKNKKILFDGDEFVFFDKGKLVKIKKEDFKRVNGVELIITENLYSFEPVEDKAIKGFNSDEIRRYIEWKAEAKGVKNPLLTYGKFGDSIFSFIFPEGERFIKRYFNNKVSGVKSFALSVYNSFRKTLDENSLFIVNYKNLFLFLAIGKDSPVFIRKKLNLDDEEIINEANTTIRFVSERYNIKLTKIFSTIEFPAENLILIDRDYLGEILK